MVILGTIQNHLYFCNLLIGLLFYTWPAEMSSSVNAEDILPRETVLKGVEDVADTDNLEDQQEVEDL